MGIYLVNFLVYTMAMVGLLFICLMVYKKTMSNTKCTKNNDELVVENALKLAPRKTVYVVKVGGEKFLIAGDAERTTFLAKLNGQELTKEVMTTVPVKFDENVATEYKSSVADYSEVMKAIKMTRRKQPVMREMLRKLEAQSFTEEVNNEQKVV